MKSIAENVDAYSDALAPLSEAVGRYLKHPSVVGKDGAMKIGHRPWVAELNYMFTLYPGIESGPLQRYARQFKIEIPEVYRDVLRELNGGFCFGMSLCGVPRSMLGEPALLDRTILQCHDLATAVNVWRNEYRVPAEWFHFGGRDFSFTENVGYFIDDPRIVCAKKSGKVIGEWASFQEFLADELKASEKLEEKLNPRP